MIKLSRVIVVGALLMFFIIFLVAFVGFRESHNPSLTTPETDSYNILRRLPPKEIIERDRVELPEYWPHDGIEAVYLWTNPQAESRFQEYNSYMSKELKEKLYIPDETPFDTTSLHYFFARGFDRYLPWIKRLHIIAPDSVVDIPFNTSHSRIKVTRYSEFIPNEALPIFNWRSVLIHVALSLENLSKQFILLDDKTFPLAYLPPTSFRSTKGEILLPLMLSNLSTPLDQENLNIRNHSNQVVRNAIVRYEERLGVEDSAELLKNTLDYDFETRGLTLMDRQVIVDLNQLCASELAETQLHRFRKKDSVDLIQMHHQFIHLMNTVYKQPYVAESILHKADKNEDGKLERDEILSLAQSIGLSAPRLSQFIYDIFENPNITNSKTIVEVKNLVQAPHIASFVAAQGMRKQFKFQVVNSTTLAFDLKRGRSVNIQQIVSALMSGRISNAWLGPLVTSTSGVRARSFLEPIFLVLFPTPSSLEVSYRPYEHLSLIIGGGFMSFFVLTCWIVSKILLQTPRRVAMD